MDRDDSANSIASDGFLEARLHPLCEAFEAECRARPAIEDFLQGWQGEERRALLTELLHLELYYYPSGKEPSLADYRKRFPQDAELLERVLRDNLTASTAPQTVSDDVMLADSVAMPAG